MTSLLVRDSKAPGGLRPNRSLLPPNADIEADEAPGHYRYHTDQVALITHDTLFCFRRITFDAWCQLVDLYGVDGPAIAVVGSCC
jgi:hypothetical protein